MKIEGQYNEAIVYAKVITEGAVEQIRQLCDQEFTKGSTIRVMPDVHVGKGCTIGMTMTVCDKVVPNLVGVDIGCGMYTVKLGKIELEMKSLDQAVHNIPAGKRVWSGRQKTFDLTGLHCYRFLRDTKRLERSLGTLGGGNHFIEVNQGQAGDCYLVIHTGSRNLGKQVAEYYQNLAVECRQGKDIYYQQREQMIAQYKAAGRRQELQEALKQLQWEAKELFVPEELCYLEGQYKDEYLHDLAICQQFAKANRELIAQLILAELGISAEDSFHTIHNYIDLETSILRKGAVSAKADERLLIPVNMRDGSILCRGRGNADWNYSAPHGAGRLLSRNQAKERLSLEVFQQQMEGIYTTSVSAATLDESPMAYKQMTDILDVITETAEVLEILKPIYNFKSS